MKMAQKQFIVEVCKGILAEIDHPAVELYEASPDGDEPVMSPTASATPPVDRFVCRFVFYLSAR